MKRVWFTGSAAGWHPQLYELFFTRTPWGRRLRGEEQQPICAMLHEYVRGDDRVLEIGAGTGAYTSLLVELAASVEVREPSPAMRHYLAERARRQHWTGVHVVHGRLPRPLNLDTHYEAVVAVGVLNYVEELEAALGAIADALEPEGSIIVNVPTGERPVGRRYRLVESLGRRRVMCRTRLDVGLAAARCELRICIGPVPAGVTDLYVLRRAPSIPLRPHGR